MDIEFMREVSRLLEINRCFCLKIEGGKYLIFEYPENTYATTEDITDITFFTSLKSVKMHQGRASDYYQGKKEIEIRYSEIAIYGVCKDRM